MNEELRMQNEELPVAGRRRVWRLASGLRTKKARSVQAPTSKRPEKHQASRGKGEHSTPNIQHLTPNVRPMFEAAGKIVG